MSTLAQLIYQNSPFKLFPEALSGHCFICGYPTSDGFPTKKIIKDTFMDHDKIKRPESPVVCTPCVFSMQETIPLNGKEGQRMRNYSHLVTESAWIPATKADKAKMKAFLLTPQTGTWGACLADSGQKHLIFRCPINTNNPQKNRILLEERICFYSKTLLEKTINEVETLLSMGFSKAELETQQWKSNKLYKLTPEQMTIWHELSAKCKHNKGSGEFALALFLGQKYESNIFRNSQRPNSDHPPVNELGHLGEETIDLLGDSGECNTVIGVYNGSFPIRQLPLFEDGRNCPGKE